MDDFSVAFTPAGLLRVSSAPLIGDAVVEKVAALEFDLFLSRIVFLDRDGEL